AHAARQNAHVRRKRRAQAPNIYHPPHSKGGNLYVSAWMGCFAAWCRNGCGHLAVERHWRAPPLHSVGAALLRCRSFPLSSGARPDLRPLQQMRSTWGCTLCRFEKSGEEPFGCRVVLLQSLLVDVGLGPSQRREEVL